MAKNTKFISVMRNLRSLLKAGYIPPLNCQLYRVNQETPYLQLVRFNYSSSNRTPIFKPDNRKFIPELLFLHTYFPDKKIVAVQILKPFPYAKEKQIYHLRGGILKITDQVKFSEDDIYKFPTFFKPLYQGY